MCSKPVSSSFSPSFLLGSSQPARYTGDGGHATHSIGLNLVATKNQNREEIVSLNKALADLSSGFAVYVENMIKNKISECSEKEGIKKIGSLKILRDKVYGE